MKITAKTTKSTAVVATKANSYAAYNRMKAEARKIYTAGKAALEQSGKTPEEAKATMKARINERRNAEALQHAVREHMANQQPRLYASIGDILAVKMAKEV